MIIEDVRFKLRDGREAVLRSPKEEDIESTRQKEKRNYLNRRMNPQMKP